jgi:hypothetical protein
MESVNVSKLRVYLPSWAVSLLLLIGGSAVAYADGCVGPGSSTAGDPNGSITLASALFATGNTLSSQAGDACNVGIYTFSNFSITASTGFIPASPFSATFSVVNNGGISGLDIAHTNLAGGKDIRIFMTVQPGVSFMLLATGPGETVTEVLCDTATSQSGQCAGPGVGGTILGQGSATGSSSVGIPVSPNSIDYIFKDVSGGSELTQYLPMPEPGSMSLMGAGLLMLGLLGRRLKH